MLALSVMCKEGCGLRRVTLLRSRKASTWTWCSPVAQREVRLRVSEVWRRGRLAKKGARDNMCRRTEHRMAESFSPPNRRTSVERYCLTELCTLLQRGWEEGRACLEGREEGGWKRG